MRPLDEPLSNGGRSLLDILVDEKTAPPDANILRESALNQIDRALELLTPRESEVIRLYFGLDGSESRRNRRNDESHARADSPNQREGTQKATPSGALRGARVNNQMAYYVKVSNAVTAHVGGVKKKRIFGNYGFTAGEIRGCR